MTAPKTPEACLAAARSMARRAGLFVVEKPDCFLLYREIKHGKNECVGRRRSAKDLFYLVRKSTRKDTA